MVHFPISEIDLQWWLPPLIAFCVAALSSMSGVSGAFLILPIQVSLLGIAGPVVSSTNLLYNVIAIPGGVYRYLREQRVMFPLVRSVLLGLLPGIVVGAIVRVRWLPDPATFKPFAGLVLLYLAVRLIASILAKRTTPVPVGGQDGFRIRLLKTSHRILAFEFDGETYRASTVRLSLFSLGVGIVGGAYGIGGGAILAPLLVAVFGLPVHTIAGATLLTTFIASVAGVVVYGSLGMLTRGLIPAVSPDWMLGGLFGLGGLVGMYVGARLQRFVPARYIKIILSLLILSVALRYVAELFL